jgi:hypothetical protein
MHALEDLYNEVRIRPPSLASARPSTSTTRARAAPRSSVRGSRLALTWSRRSGSSLIKAIVAAAVRRRPRHPYHPLRVPVA